MPETRSPYIDELAKTVLKQAEVHCRSLNLDPAPHLTLLTELIIHEISVALEEMASDRINGGPAMAYALNQPFWQKIYFADASQRAARALHNQTAAAQRRSSNNYP